MDLQIAPGKYVIAVSGGVDSMVLLHLLAQLPHVELAVAHFDHGIREDSDEDRRLVEAAADALDLPFVSVRGNLGPRTSEAAARAARYHFLEQVRQEQGARAIVTAHHQDDMLETAIINMLRGTGPRGLSSLRSTDTIVRPLLHLTKDQLRAYARQHNIVWREDSTNADERYLRNYVRRVIVPRLTPAQRQDLLSRIHAAAELNTRIDALLPSLEQADELPRSWFIGLPHAVSAEVLAAWLRGRGATFDRRTINRLVIFAKTAVPGKRADIDKQYQLEISKNLLKLSSR
jgi:tRNA(Ile)-lysidine synthetase-like protein